MNNSNQVHADNDDDDKNDDILLATTTAATAAASSLLMPFGRDNVELITDANTTFARGAFGELSIALKKKINNRNDNCLADLSDDDNNDDDSPFVAIKTIEQAIVRKGGNSVGFGGGGFGFSTAFTTPQQPTTAGDNTTFQLSKQVFSEILALRLLQPHPNIVPLVAMFPSPSRTGISFAFEYAPMDLYQVLEWRRKRERLGLLAFTTIQRVFWDVLHALKHCHAHGILHRDIKPGNLLVSSSSDGYHNIQLCDFGLAKPFAMERRDDNNNDNFPIPATATENTSKGLCTLWYRPPEVLLGGGGASVFAHPCVDMYSAGLVLAELIAGRPLWMGQNVLGQLAMVFDALGTPGAETTSSSLTKLPDYGKLTFAAKPAKEWHVILPRVAEDASGTLQRMLHHFVALSPEDRWSAQQCLNEIDEGSDISRIDLAQDLLVPLSLRVPPMIFEHGNDAVIDEETKMNVRKQMAIRLAKSRRTFLSSTESSWTGPELPEASSRITFNELSATFAEKFAAK